MSQNKSKHTTNKKRPTRNGKRIAGFLLKAGIGLAGLAVAVLAVLWVLQTASPNKVPLEATGGPRLKVDQDKVDLGTLKLGQTIPVRFEIANVGDQVLQFTEAPYLEVVAGCCPQTPAIGSMRLKPGETTTVTFYMMMHTGMGGYHDFRLHLKTNDPTQMDRTVTILSNWV